MPDDDASLLGINSKYLIFGISCAQTEQGVGELPVYEDHECSPLSEENKGHKEAVLWI